MKDINKKKIAIGALSVAIVISMGFSIYTSKNLDNDSNDNNKVAVNKFDKEKDKSNDGKKEEEIILNPLDGTENPALSEGKTELNSNEINKAVKEVREAFREYKFEKGVEILNDLNDKKKLVGDAEILKKLQFDGTIMTNIIPFHSETVNGPTVGEGVVSGQALLNLMTGFQDPENLLIATIYLDSSIRGKVMDYGGSLNPVFEEGKIPQIMTSTTVEIPDDILIMYPETVKYHKIPFLLDGNSLNAYILESENGQLKFYSIESLSERAPYYTVDQWTKIQNNIKKGLPAMDGVLEMYSSNSNTPESNDTKTDDVKSEDIKTEDIKTDSETEK